MQRILLIKSLFLLACYNYKSSLPGMHNRMGGRAGPSKRRRKKKSTTSCEQRARSIENARTRVSNTSEESRFVSREPLRQVASYFVHGSAPVGTHL